MLEVSKGDTVEVQALCDGPSAAHIAANRDSFSFHFIKDVSRFSEYNPKDRINAESATFTPSGSGLQTLTGNLVSLPRGLWLLVGKITFAATGGSANYTRHDSYWSNANGSSSAPSGYVSPDSMRYVVKRLLFHLVLQL